MTNASNTVEILIKAIDNASPVFSSVVDGLGQVTSSMDTLSKPVADVAGSLLKIEAAAIAGGAALTVLAINTAGKFDSSFREISTLIDEPLEKLGAFRNAILDYAGDSTQSLGDISGAVYQAISLGVDYTDSLDAVRQAEVLAVAGRADLKTSTEVLLGSLNAYGLGMEDATRFSDALFQAVKDGKTTLPELGGALANVTGTAATLKVPFETLLASISTLTATGMPTTQAVTAINAAMSAMLAPSEEAQKTAADLGIEFNAAAVKSKGFEVVLQDVAKATGGNEDQIKKLFGSTEALKAILPLTGAAADKFAEALENQAKKAGVAKTAYDKMVDTLEAGNQKIANAVEVTLTAIGTPLLDEYQGIQAAIAAVFDAIAKSVQGGGLKKFVAEIEKIAAEMEKTLEAVAKNLPAALGKADYSGFINGLNTIKDAVSRLFDGADLTTPEGLAKVVTQLGLGFQSLSTFAAGAIDQLKPMAETAISLAETIAKLDPDTIALAGKIGALGLAIQTALPFLNTLLLAMQTMASGGAIAGIAKSLAGPAGLVVGLLLAADGFQKAYDAAKLYYDQLEQDKSLAEDTAKNTKGLADGYAEIAKRTGIAIGSTAQFNQAVKDGTLVFDEANGKWVAGTTTLEHWQKEIEKVKGKTSDLSGAMTDQVEAVDDASKAMDTNKEKTIAANAAYHVMMGTTPELARRMAEMAAAEGPLDKSAAAFDKTAGKAGKLETELEKLASNERIKFMEFGVTLSTERMRQDTEQFKVLMGSIDKSIEDSGKLLSNYATAIDNVFRGPSKEAQNLLTDMINNENTRRDKLVNAQTDYLKAFSDMLTQRSRAIRDGNAVIKIEAEGLAPHIEAFMWEIVKQIQIRVNEESEALLLGFNGSPDGL